MFAAFQLFLKFAGALSLRAATASFARSAASLSPSFMYLPIVAVKFLQLHAMRRCRFSVADGVARHRSRLFWL